MILAPWAQIINKPLDSMDFCITFFIPPAQAAQAVNTFANASGQWRSSVCGGVRKLLPYQLCWPLSQPQVKNEIHPKHIFSNAVLILLVGCLSLSLSFLLSVSFSLSSLWHQVCLSAAMPQCLGKMGSDPDWSPWRWHKHNPSPRGTTNLSLVWQTRQAKEPPRMPWVASHRENIWVATVNLTVVTAELLGTQKAFGDTGQLLGTHRVGQAHSKHNLSHCSCQPPGKEMPPPSSKVLLNSQIQDLHSSVSANYSDFLQIRNFFLCK